MSSWAATDFLADSLRYNEKEFQRGLPVPLYEYRCTACGHVFERIQSFSAPEQSECPKCGKVGERMLSAPAIQFKGSGFYLTDYGKAGGGKSGAPKGEGGSGSSSGSESKTSPGASESSSSGSTAAPASTPSAPSAPSTSSSGSGGSSTSSGGGGS